MNKTLNIAIYFPTIGSGGAQRHISELFNNWKYSKGVVFTIFGPKLVQDIIPYSENIKFCVMPNYTKRLLFRFFWEIFFSKKYFKSYDILFVPLGLYIGSMRPIISMSRNLLLFDSTQISRLKNYKIKIATIAYKYFQLYTFKNSESVIFLSNYALNLISNLYPKIINNSLIINHGISDNFFVQSKLIKNLSECSVDNPFNLLYVSSFYEYKNHDSLLEVFKQLALKYPLKLTLIGSFPTSDIKKKIVDYVSETNKFLEYESIEIFEKMSLNDIVKYYHSSDLFVFPSSVENMPNALVEAMAAGLPILSSSKQPMPEFLNKCGLYFDPDDKSSLLYSLEKLITNYDLRERYSRLASAESLNYSWKSTSNKTIDILTRHILMKQ